MGCCASRPSHDDDDQPQHERETTEDRRAQVSQTTTDTTSTTQTTRRRTRRAPNLPLSEHYNEPVRLHVWHSKRRTWTRAELDRERGEFFETRVTGRSEVWAALATAISMIRAGDLATAQGIVDAAGVTIPTGDLCEGCYDEQGVLYRLPQCIVSDPENIVKSSSDGARSKSTPDDPGEEQDEDTEALSDGKLTTDDASGDELIADDLERRRDEKGKTSERDLIRVRARLSDRGGPDLMLLMGKRQTVGFLARKVHQEAGATNRQRVRIVYLGRMLKEHESLPEQGWQSGHIVNAMIVTRASPS